MDSLNGIRVPLVVNGLQQKAIAKAVYLQCQALKRLMKSINIRSQTRREGQEY
jgi:hypothetical protein